MRPTDTTYDELQHAFDHFNDALFAGKLPGCLLTLQREKRTMGYFLAHRFVHLADGSVTDEIAMNPVHFGIVPIGEIMQTLVHEMAHLWQHHFGTPGRVRYHNAEWGAKMEAIGLMPSDTGAPGGRKTGDHMADYAIAGGRFEMALAQLLDDAFTISWADRYPPWGAVKGYVAQVLTTTTSVPHNARPLEASSLPAVAIKPSRPAELVWPVQPTLSTAQTRAKFTCPSCGANLWGKPALNVLCVDCDVRFQAA